jgi:lysophospholipase L1-like esterase
MARRGNAVVANWYDLAAAPDQNILKKDHIHPNGRGTVVFASLVNDAIASFAGG